MLKKGKKALSILLSAALVVSGLSIISGKVRAEGEEGYGLSNPRIAYNTRETVTLGSYWQEDTNGDGIADVNDDKQPIVWQVLEKYDDGTALVLSDKILDAKAYNYEDTQVTWETSSVRNWLNNDFYNNAFSANEKTAIIESDVINEENSELGTEGGKNTKDNVFLLSLEEVVNTADGFVYYSGTNDWAKTAKVTSYANKKSLDVYIDGTGYWWIRSIGLNGYKYFINGSGKVFNRRVNFDEEYGVRPVLRVNTNSSYVKITEKVNISLNSEWDTVTFGEYDGNAINWRVLNVTGDDAFLVSDIILDKKSYNDFNTSITWKDSTIRKWLNEDFINNSFNEAEKEMIKTSVVVNYDKEYWGTEGGEDTEDKIFLLSERDMVNPEYGFPERYEIDSETRLAKDKNGNFNFWWLRSPGDDTNNAAGVSRWGTADDCASVSKSDGGIRPALHINLKSSAWTKGEKVVAGDMSKEEKPTPTKQPTPTIAPTAVPTQNSTPTNVPTSVPTLNPTERSDTLPQISPTDNATPTVTPASESIPIVAKDNKTTFSIKNKATVKKTTKIKVKDKDKIKKITLNGKTVKIKKNKTSVTIKLKSYKKTLKKKGKWNKLVVTDVNGNTKTIKFKTK